MPLAESELKELKVAVARAEERTSAEIVPVVWDQSDDYPVAVWRGAGISAAVGLVLCVAFIQVYSGWGIFWLLTGWGVALVVSAAGLLGGLAGAFVPSITRALIGNDRLSTAVHLRAMQAFVEEEVFATRERTGILLFISLFEHRVEILADTGIHAKVRPEDWAEIVARIREGIRAGKLSDGLIEAFEMCGRLLEERGVAIREDDANELSNAVRIRGAGR